MATVDSTGAKSAPKRELNVGKEVAALGRMTVNELRERYADVFGERTRAGNKAWLVKRIAWRIQAMAEGDLSDRARRRATELANDADLRMSPPKAERPVTPTTRLGSPDERVPIIGTRLTREYKGHTYFVLVKSNGFEFEGDVYKSLSSVAKAITGQKEIPTQPGYNEQAACGGSAEPSRRDHTPCPRRTACRPE